MGNAPTTPTPTKHEEELSDEIFDSNENSDELSEQELEEIVPTTTSTSTKQELQQEVTNTEQKLDTPDKSKDINVSTNNFSNLTEEELDDKLIEVCRTPTTTSQQKSQATNDATTLISLGANVNAISVIYIENLPLIFHAYYNKNTKLLELLLNKKANINVLNNSGMTLLQEICSWHREDPVCLEMVKILLEKGAAIDLKNNTYQHCASLGITTGGFDFTALHYASLHGNKEMVIELLSYGANPLLINKSKDRASVRANTPEIKEILLKAEKHWEEFGCSKTKIDNAKKIVRLVEKYEFCAKIKNEGPYRMTLRKLVESEALKLNDTFKACKLSKEEIARLVEYYSDRPHFQASKGKLNQTLKQVLTPPTTTPGTEVSGPNNNNAVTENTKQQG